jgi:hypothetical protein
MEELEGVPSIKVITIVLDGDEVTPKIDLGDIHPFIAFAILTKAVETLKEIMCDPQITYQGESLNPIYEYEFDDDDDEE